MIVVRTLLLLAGLATAAYGIELVLKMSPVDRMSIAVWFLGAIVIHDAILAPLSAGAGVLGDHVFPARVRGPVTVGAVITFTLIVVAAPVLFRGGAVANPTVLDRDYPLGLAVALVVVWAAVGIVVYRRRRRSRAAPARHRPGRILRPRGE